MYTILQIIYKHKITMRTGGALINPAVQNCFIFRSRLIRYHFYSGHIQEYFEPAEQTK